METKMAYLGDSSLCEDGISPWAGNFPYKHKNLSAPPPPQSSQCYCRLNSNKYTAVNKIFSSDFNLRMPL